MGSWIFWRLEGRGGLRCPLFLEGWFVSWGQVIGLGWGFKEVVLYSGMHRVWQILTR